MRYLIWRSSPLLLTVADLWRVRSYSNGICYVLITDGLALILIRFAPEIDDLTFGLGVGPSTQQCSSLRTGSNRSAGIDGGRNFFDQLRV